MHMNIYVFFTKYEYFMYFLVSRFFTRFFAGSDPVHILGFVGSMTGPVPITLFQTLKLLDGCIQMLPSNKYYTVYTSRKVLKYVIKHNFLCKPETQLCCI